MAEKMFTEAAHRGLADAEEMLKQIEEIRKKFFGTAPPTTHCSNTYGVSRSPEGSKVILT